MASKEIVVRQVWKHNVRNELELISGAIFDFPYASLDTEFPGTVFTPTTGTHWWQLSADEKYALMKANVDKLNLIQLGLTLSDADGNLPDFGTDFAYVWEFNFKDFDIKTDDCNKESIELLQKQGIDFSMNRNWGIDSRIFSKWFLESSLVFCRRFITWSSFHGSYDFAYMIKALRQQKLPKDLSGFMAQVYHYFGLHVYDIKNMIMSCNGLYGGLESVAKALKVERVGKAHTAGSDSLLTMQIFLQLQHVYFSGEEKEEEMRDKYRFKLYGFDEPKSKSSRPRIESSPQNQFKIECPMPQIQLRTTANVRGPSPIIVYTPSFILC